MHAAVSLNASAGEMGLLAAVETMPALLVGLFVGESSVRELIFGFNI